MSTTPSIAEPSRPAVTALPVVEVTIPVYNEERALAASIERLVRHLETAFPFPARITIVDNASADATWKIARELAVRHAAVSALRLPEKGRGREDKLAAIGLRVRHWVSFHGVALNVDPVLEHFSGIVPCGVRDQGVTSLADLGVAASMDEVDRVLRGEFERLFGPTVTRSATP